MLGRGAADWRWLAAGVVAAALWPPLAWLIDRITHRGSPGSPASRPLPL
jgi:hypothetical protein